MFIAFDDRHSAASTYHQLGMVAQEQRRFAEAEDAYRKALEIKVAFNDRHSAASTYHQLGMVAQEQRRFADAEDAYKRALEIYVAFNDRYEQAETYHQLGGVAEEQRRFADAGDAYKKALESYVDFDDLRGAAIVLRSIARLWAVTDKPDIVLWRKSSRSRPNGPGRCSKSRSEVSRTVPRLRI
jgi:tetratricopeptide (TPR) repeat protein